MTWKTDFLLIILFVLLLFPNLGSRTLWQDEAETALVARVVAKRGLPYAMDERGPISQDWTYQFSVSPLWRWHPWLQFYVTALSFKLFGESSLTARLPFTITGVIFFWYYLRFLKRRGPKNPVFFLIASLLVLTSTPLLLHLRQARYYALSVLFTLVALDGYLDIKDGKRSFRYVIGSIALFHSFLPGALALQVSFWIDALRHPIASLQNDGGRSFFLRFARAFALTLLPTLPWAWWLKIGGQNLNFNPELIKQHLWQHYLYIHKFIVPFFLIAALAFQQVRKLLRSDSNSLLFFIIIAVNLSLYTVNHPYFFRYLVPLIPLVTYFVALILASLPFSFAFISFLLIVQMSWRTFPGYLYEITHPYVGTNEQLVTWMEKLHPESERDGASEEVGRGDRIPTVAANYDDFTFRFHTPLLVYGAQHLPTLTTCTDVIIIFPEWGNEERLKQIAVDCSLKSVDTSISYAKLADDPNPLSHRFSPPITGSVKIYYTQRP